MVEALEPEQFALRVRELALAAHRLLRDPAATRREVVELSRQLDELRRQRQRQRRNAPESEIDRWLLSAARQIREYGSVHSEAFAAG